MAPPSEDADAQSQVLDLWIETSAEGATVTVVGPEHPVFTAFQQGGPDRVVVDLANVSVGEPRDVVSDDPSLVQSVRVEPVDAGGLETMARVEVMLSGPADYDVRPGEGVLVIEVAPIDAAAAEASDESVAAEDPWAEDAESETAESDVEGEDPWAAETSEEPAPPAAPATELTGIDARGAGEGTMIHLQADGSVESAMTFTLEDPERLVIDLPEMTHTIEAPTLEVGSAQVARVRIGSHSDKIRVVVDGGSADEPFDGRRLIPTAGGLVVALGSGAELDAAVASVTGPALQIAEAIAPEVAEAIAPELAVEGEELPEAEGEAWVPAEELGELAESPEADDSEQGVEVAEADAMESETGNAAESAEVPEGNATIYGVELDSQADNDRIVVLGDRPIDYLIYEPDAETVVLSIAGATIAPEAAVRIAPEDQGAVSLVTAFEQPEVETPEVRVVVKRAANLMPAISRSGSLLMLDFSRSGGTAARPPVFDGTGAADTLAASGELAPEFAAAPPIDLGMDIAMDANGMPAAMAPDAGIPLDAMPADAAINPPAAIEILNEGGLLDGKEYVGRRISLDFKEVDIADVLRLIAEVSDLNVIAGDEVKGKVTIRLVDVPWDQALDVVLLTQGLGFARIGNVLRIAASDVLAQEEELRLQERRAKEKLEDLVVKLQPVNYADVKDVSGMVKELLTPRGSVNTDTRTNTLIIKDIASVIDEATALVKAVDTMTPQVMIEAKIVEAGLEFSRELGSTWTFGSNPLTEATLGGRDYVFQPGDDDGIADGLGNQVVFGNPITAGPTGLLGLAASVLDQKFNFEVELQAAEVNGDGKVISSPRIVTLDNSTATIEQGVSIPFQTFENGDAQLEFVDAVLKLDVTPHITSDDSIIMEIKVSRNAPDDSVFTLTGSPAIAKNQVETETLVKDGQTLVLGGIYVVDRSERQSRVPYLSRLPFIGALFKSDEYSDSRKELLVFVSPRIVVTPGGDAS